MYLDILKIYKKGLSLKKLSKASNFSISGVAKYIEKNKKLGYINDDGEITKIGKKHLKDTKIENAIILAAGWGSRLAPVTDTIPKPLVVVNGKPIIETSIEAILDAGINDITIVIGRKKEMFNYLIEKYNVKLVYNNLWNVRDNIESLVRVRNILGNTLIVEGDTIVMNKNVILTHIKDSIGCGTKRDGEWDEWSFQLNGKNIISYRKDKRDSVFWKGMFYYNKELSNHIKKYLETTFQEHPSEYSKDIVIKSGEIANNLNINMRWYKVKEKDLIEIDTVEELIALDKSYMKYRGNKNE